MSFEKPEDAIWKALNDERGAYRLSPAQVVGEFKKRGIDLDLRTFTKLMSRLPEGEYWDYPEPLLDFVSGLAAAIKPKRVLDPWVSCGELLSAIYESSSFELGVGICPSEDAREIAASLNSQSPIRWVTGDPVDEVSKLDGTFDLVVSRSPWSLARKARQIADDGAVIDDDIGSFTNYQALSKLASDGTALLIVNSAFVTSPRPTGWFAQRTALAVNLEALIYFPPGFFSLAAVDGYLCVFSKHRSDGAVFLGEISDSADHNKVLLGNLLVRRSTPDISLGKLHSGLFPGYKQLRASDQSEQAARRMGLQGRPLSDLILEVNLTKSSELADFPQRDNAVFLPLIGRSKAADSTGALSLKAHNYAQVVLNPALASASYLSSYFNSSLGFQCRESAEGGAVIPKISKERLQAATVYVPDLKTQLQCVSLESRALNIISDVDGIVKTLMRQPRKYKEAAEALLKVNRDDSFERWIANIPFPLASILWIYWGERSDDKAAYEHLLHFFEALAEFVAIILWSAISTDRQLTSNEKYPLRPQSPLNNPVQKSTFGSWNELASRLARFVRTVSNDKDMRKTVLAAFGNPLDLSSLEMLFDTTLVSALASANSIRNRVSHGGIVGAGEAQRLRTDLETLLGEIRSLMTSNWLDLPLYRAATATYDETGAFKSEVERIMGAAIPFVKSNVTLKDPVKRGRLFLLPAESSSPIVLAPLLVIAPGPRTTQNACYFYNSQFGDELRFVSYHFDQEAELLLKDEQSVAALERLISCTG